MKETVSQQLIAFKHTNCARTGCSAAVMASGSGMRKGVGGAADEDDALSFIRLSPC